MSINEPGSILRRNPYRDRRSFVARAMGLSPIGDIASGGMAESELTDKTWETQTDWDNAVDRDRVVTRGIGDRVADEIWQGYDPNYLSNLEFYLTFDEDSGSTATDATGNGNDGSINGATLGETGILGSSALGFDGSSDDVTVPSTSALTPGTSEFTIAFWSYYRSDTSNFNTGMAKGVTGGGEFLFYAQNALAENQGYRIYVDGGADQTEFSDSPISANTWEFYTVTRRSGNWYLYKDANQYASVGASANISTSKDWSIAAADEGTARYNDAIIDEPMYFNTGLTDSQVQSLYDTASSGFLESDTKSFAASTQPNLSNLDYSLNGETIDLDVIGSPGTVDEEVVTQTLDGSASYSLTWSSSHTDFRIKPNLSTAAVDTTPVVRSVTITPP